MTGRSRFVIVAYGAVQTGGPEALHHFAAELRTQGHDAQMYYLEPIDPVVIGHYHRRYGIERITDRRDLALSTLIIPEVVDPAPWSDVPVQSRWVWWLSEVRYHPLAAYAGWGFLFQSHAIMEQFAACGCAGLLLTDYIIDEFHAPLEARKDPVVAFSGQRSSAYAALALRGCGLGTVQLRGMSVAEMIAALDRASLYIDFGWHPGADRGPREAALRGCVVLVNACRNAKHPLDVPLAPEYRIEWVERYRLVSSVTAIANQLDLHRDRQHGYRNWVSGARARFRAEVHELVAAATGDPGRWTARILEAAGLDLWHRQQTVQYIHQLRNLNDLASELLAPPDRTEEVMAENAKLKVMLEPRLVRWAMAINGWLRRLR